MKNTNPLLFQDNRILVTGGTGSMGKTFVKRVLSGEFGVPKKVIVFSRDEGKQHYMRLDYLHKKVSTDEVIYNNFRNVLEFRLGDVRDYRSISMAMRDADIVINAAALKQVPACEYFLALHPDELNAEGWMDFTQKTYGLLHQQKDWFPEPIS